MNFCKYCKHEIIIIKGCNFYTGYFCKNCCSGGMIYDHNNCCKNPDITDLQFERSDGIWVRRSGCKNCKSITGPQKKKGFDFKNLPFLSQEAFLLNKKNKDACRDSIYNEIELHKAKTQTSRQLEYENKQLEFQKKYNYVMQSEDWRQIRKLALERDNYLCQGCRLKKAAEVHHTTYKNLGDELLFQLVSLCVNCHQKLHPDKNIL